MTDVALPNKMVIPTRKLKPEPMPAAAESTDIMQRLRVRTASTHAATEALPLMRALLSPTADADAYGRYLAALHGIYRAVEPTLYGAVSPPVLRLLGVRPKLPALEQDLAALMSSRGEQLGASAVRPARDLPGRIRAAVQGEFAALGGLYVLEGATLGGRVIARRLRQQWGPESDMPFTFLEFRGANPGREWRRFGDGIRLCCARHPDDEAAPIGDRIVDGAVAVFDAMHQAFREAGAEDETGDET